MIKKKVKKKATKNKVIKKKVTTEKAAKKATILLDVSGWGVELVIGHIDKETAEQINEDMSWEEVEEIVGHWADIDDIIHEYLPISPPTFSNKDIAINRIEAGIKETPIKGEGYLMVTVSEEKGVFGTVTVRPDTKEVSYYNKKYKIGEDYMDLVEGFNCDGKDQILNMDHTSTVGKCVETIIYNRKNEKQIWPKVVNISSKTNKNFVLSVSPSFVYRQIEENDMLDEDDIFSANCQEFAFEKLKRNKN